MHRPGTKLDAIHREKFLGVVFVDHTVAFDTVCHRALRKKVGIYELTKDFKFTKILEMLLEDRQFYAALNGKNTSWRKQSNNLPQGSVLLPTIFNIQPIGQHKRNFFYADDLALAANTKWRDWMNIIRTIIFNQTHVKQRPVQPNVRGELRVRWRKTELKYSAYPKYLGITLDWTLTYKQHCEATKKKLAARTIITDKLEGSKWS